MCAVAYVVLPRNWSEGRKNHPLYGKQRVPIMRFARESGLYVAHTVCEILEGAPADPFARVGFERLLCYRDNVLVDQRSRFSAGELELAVLFEYFRRCRIAVIEVSSGLNLVENRGLVDRVSSRAAPEELAAVKRRLTLAKSRATRRRNGTKPGRRPFGSLPGEQEVIREIWRLRRKPRNQPRRSYREIAEILNSRRMLTRSGRPWQAKTIQGILKRTKPWLLERDQARPDLRVRVW